MTLNRETAHAAHAAPDGLVPEAFDTIVFAGGGPSTMVYGGCMRYLEHTGVLPGAVRTFVGTSAGAVFAFLCTLGMSFDQVDAWAREHIENGDLTTLDVGGLLLLPDRLGIDDGERIMGALRTALRRALRREEVTFAELAKATGRNLVVCACNVTLECQEFFGVDTTPSVSVLLALRMSICLPIIFTPVVHAGCMYVDGGLLDNLPTDFAAWSAIGHRRTLALRVRRGPPRPPSEGDAPLPTLAAYLMQVAQTVLRRANDQTHSARGPGEPQEGGGGGVRLVELEVRDEADSRSDLETLEFDMASMTFALSTATLDRQTQAGYEALRKALS
jgi:predicted acylesterase/phospholipase RssA